MLVEGWREIQLNACCSLHCTGNIKASLLICRLLQHNICIWSCFKATHSLPLWSMPSENLHNHWGSIKFYCKCCDGTGGGKWRKRGFNVLHPLWKSWVLLSQVNILENERVIMSGNICTSRSNYYIQSVMSHCKSISLLMSRKQRGLEDSEHAEKHPELSNYVPCLLL